METKPLLYGLIGFFIGGLLVSVAASTFEKSELQDDSMSSMSVRLESKSGDDFDRQFLSDMILHHEGAVEMAELAKTRANHQEIKDLSDDIIISQGKEIGEMRSWMKSWGYPAIATPDNHMSH